MNRLFLALKAQLYDYKSLQSDFKGSIKGRWVADENLHLTLCYFGEAYSIDELLDKLPALVREIEPLSVSSLGYFEYNNILYAKVKGKALETLQSSICSSFSLSDTKIFIPHVTLIRVKDIQNKTAFKDKLKHYKNRRVGILDTRVELINSHLGPKGARYETIKKFYPSIKND
jgi:RNA 2',3'-cyclic 3'-phosphodiesterase